MTVVSARCPDSVQEISRSSDPYNAVAENSSESCKSDGPVPTPGQSNPTWKVSLGLVSACFPGARKHVFEGREPVPVPSLAHLGHAAPAAAAFADVLSMGPSLSPHSSSSSVAPRAAPARISPRPAIGRDPVSVGARTR
jgi:hypothetical protein